MNEARADRRRRRKAAPRGAAATRRRRALRWSRRARRKKRCKLCDRADLILTDLQLPGMDGLQLLSPIRRAEPDGARDRHDGIRHRGECRRSDEVRGGGLPAEAVLARSPDGGGQQGAGGQRAARREPATEGRARAALPVRQHRRPQPRRCRRSSPPSRAWRRRGPRCCWRARAESART